MSLEKQSFEISYVKIKFGVVSLFVNGAPVVLTSVARIQLSKPAQKTSIWDRWDDGMKIKMNENEFLK